MLSGKGQRKVAVNEKAEEHTCMLVRWMFVMCHTGPIPSGLKAHVWRGEAGPAQSYRKVSAHQHLLSLSLAQ